MSTARVAGVAVDTRHWIGGQRVASATTFEDVSPLDGTVIAQVSRGGPAEVDAAVAAAKAAFAGWSQTPPAERSAILHGVADGIEARLEDLAQVETCDNGSLLRSHRRGVMPRVAMNFRYFADHLLELSHPDFETRGHRNHVSWDPAGVTAIITPWNAPLMLATWRIGPALAAGNTVVAKPPEWAPLTASLLADIAHDAGLPAGVLNVVQGLGTEAGAPLVAHEDVRRICFTGSVPTSQKIGASAGPMRQVASMSGAFHGVMIAVTPAGSHDTWLRWPRVSKSGCDSSSRWSAKNRKFMATRGITPRRCDRRSDPLSRVSTCARSSSRASTPSATRCRTAARSAGVTAVITPWNAPLMLATWRIGPALAAGNTVVAKPPEWAPLTASLLADIAHEAGLPPGVLNVVQGLGTEAGAPLVAHPDVRRICFTGSVPTAQRIGASAAANVTPVSFELGGKSPLLVLADADLDLAVDLAVEQLDNSGQVCLAAVRILVQESIADEFRERFLPRVAAVTQGDSRDERTDIGPLVGKAHLDRVDGFVKRAVADGARVLVGGEPNHDLNNATGGFYYLPTVFDGVTPTMEIACQEVFGPVLTLQTFATEADGVAMANDTEFGLAATLVTGDPDRAARVAAQLRAGTVWVNCFFVRDLAAPFGGSGRSGIGREGGTWSFDFYCDVKNSVFAPKGWS